MTECVTFDDYSAEPDDAVSDVASIISCSSGTYLVMVEKNVLFLCVTGV